MEMKIHVNFDKPIIDFTVDAIRSDCFPPSSFQIVNVSNVGVTYVSVCVIGFLCVCVRVNSQPDCSAHHADELIDTNYGVF